MRKILGTILFMFFIFGFAQGQPTNRFEDTEKENSALESNSGIENKENTVAFNSGGGNPGGLRAPIDDYLPVLVIVAVGFIVYAARKKKNLLS